MKLVFKDLLVLKEKKEIRAILVLQDPLEHLVKKGSKEMLEKKEHMETRELKVIRVKSVPREFKE